MTKEKQRCPWCGESPLYQKYHDEEWGVVVTDDRKHFEFLILESAQAGLSWLTILKKREGYRRAFADFDPEKVSRFTELRVERLMQNEEIVRNRLKILAAIQNAKLFLDIQREFGSFNAYCWPFVGGKPIVNARRSVKELPAKSKESELWAKDLKKRGFKFLGPTTLYAHMQAVGMVQDHLVDCFRYRQLSKSSKP
jgi:DNA-3-methyladenine glycosylase I